MRVGILRASIVASFVMLAGAAGAEPSTHWQNCTGKADVNWDLQITGCTALLQSAGEPNLAAAYTNRGTAHYEKGDYDRALADHGEAIRLDAKFARAHVNRGRARSAKDDSEGAVADFNAAIGLDAKYGDAYYNRGFVYFLKGDNERAIADLSEAILLDRKDHEAYSSRGRAHLYRGSAALALADLTQANEVNPKEAYAALWRDIAAQRSGVASRLREASVAIDMTAWPAPVIRLFLGENTVEAALAAADSADRKTKTEQVCEAHFFSGAWALRQGAKDEAARLFRLAARDCPRDFTERGAANAELKALGQTP
jgi:lipoprotein NlpI